ncbi:MAG: glycosyl hydrolase [Ignavibacteria bacterium]|nr:glycosyl hydrolase [Ignavibacteria bacterium]
MKLFLTATFILSSWLAISPNGVWSQKKAASAADEKKDLMSSATFSGLKFRSIGPAYISGRISSLAVHPNNRSTVYVGVACGGVWKTINAGTTWEPLFDGEGSYSIGCVVLDPNNPNTVWVGSGENNSQRSVAFGDGVYRSDDGGKSWKNMGLKKSEHIARIVIDPRNSDVVYVAAQGPLWGASGDRGLYKSTDGGKTWEHSLKISENTGVTDVVIDPRNPDVLYAAAYQRRRHFYTLIDGGPESALYKSTNAGKTWEKLTSGLPAELLGRIGIAISPVNPDVLYLTVEAANRAGGIFRSTNRGATWEKQNGFDAGAQYYATIFCDPKDVNRIYVMNFDIMVSDNGGKTLAPMPSTVKHVDNHVMWIDPNNTNYYLVGCDGGLYESFDRGSTWKYTPNLPISQFYRVSVDNAMPFYNVYGGTQDNNSVGGPSRTINASGITNADWFITQGGDGFKTQIDPSDPNIVYAQAQHAAICRYDKKSGEKTGIQPQPEPGEMLRWNWDTPLIISSHSPTRLYIGAQKLFRSDDRGDTWKAVSGDLSRQIDRNKLPVMGKVWGVDAVAKNVSTAFYGNLSCIAESPKKEGLIYVGTDDGLIQITENGGASWRKIEKLPGVPENAYVTCLYASQHDANTVYASFTNHQNADFTPYILKSTDAGKTWVSLKANLPESGMVWGIAEDHVNSNLLFIGTEFGVSFTTDGGKKWIQLKGGLPTIAVREVVIQKRENDLVLGTFGRGFYILDDYTPLRNVSSEALAKDATIFPIKPALLYIPARPNSGKSKGHLGDSFFTADNPEYGATFTYYLNTAPKTKKQLRKDAEKEAEKNGSATPYPSYDALRAEAEEEEPTLHFTITDKSGNLVRRITTKPQTGMNRVVWDLSYPDPNPTQLTPPPSNSYSFEFGDRIGGALVMPGEYAVSLAKRVDGVMMELVSPQSFTVQKLNNVTLPASDLAALTAFQRKIDKMQRSVFGAVEAANSIKTRLQYIKKALLDAEKPDANLLQTVSVLDKQMNKLLIALRGDVVIAKHNEPVPLSISDRVAQIVGDQIASTSAPTKTHEATYTIAANEFAPVLAELKKVIETDLVSLEKALDIAGAPWTPGRIPTWTKE